MYLKFRILAVCNKNTQFCWCRVVDSVPYAEHMYWLSGWVCECVSVFGVEFKPLV